MDKATDEIAERFVEVPRKPPTSCTAPCTIDLSAPLSIPMPNMLPLYTSAGSWVGRHTPWTLWWGSRALSVCNKPVRSSDLDGCQAESLASFPPRGPLWRHQRLHLAITETDKAQIRNVQITQIRQKKVQHNKQLVLLDSTFKLHVIFSKQIILFALLFLLHSLTHFW